MHPAPLLDGHPCHSLALGKGHAHIVFGRGAESADADNATRIALDATDATISRTHAILSREADGWYLTDQSRLGATLNGDSFQRSRLVYGDRFQIGSYVFQFNVNEIQWLGSRQAGSIMARQLGFAVGGRKILQNISLEIKPGEFVGILGGSGQGKSTMMNTLCGLRPATEGDIWLNGVALSKGESEAARIGYVPQDDIVHPELIVRDAILFAARLRLKLPPHELSMLVDRTIDRLGLAPHTTKRITQLSGGQRKRVSIATELLTRPDILFLDEPSSGLDPATEENLMSLLQSLTLTGLTVVCTTHVLERAYLFNRILYIHGGRLIFSGSADDARRHFLLDAQSPEDSAALERSPLGRIYSLVGSSDTSPEQWEQAFRESPKYVAPQQPTTTSSPPPETTQHSKVSWVQVLRVLLARQAKILAADPLNLLFLLAQALAIGFLVGWVSSDIGLAAFLVLIASMWFGCSNGAQQIVSELPVFRRERVCGLGLTTYIHSKILFLGGLTLVQAVLLSSTTFTVSHVFHPRDFNTQQFERRIKERLKQPQVQQAAQATVAFEVVDEESPNQQASREVEATPTTPAADSEEPKLAIKTFTWLARWFDLEENILDSGREEIRDQSGNQLQSGDGQPLFRAGKPAWSVVAISLGLRASAFVGAALLGVLLGLTISALVRNATQAVMWVPLVLIPQILFGGFVVSLADMSSGTRTFSSLMPSAALEKVMEVSQLYGAATPFLSNRTKTPLFLTADGAKETIEWEFAGRSLSQTYDELSKFNTAWQNQAVISDRLGQHKHASTLIAGTTRKLQRDTVTRRHDVKYLKGTPFLNLGAAATAATVLAAWVALCYLATLLGLYSKQTE